MAVLASLSSLTPLHTRSQLQRPLSGRNVLRTRREDAQNQITAARIYACHPNYVVLTVNYFTLGDKVRTLPTLLPLLTGWTATASADVTYHSYNALRDWNIPGGDTAVVFVFTLLFGATVWFVARGIWLKDRVAQKRN